MKIAYIVTGLYTGGAEIMLYNLLSKINRERFDPVVVSLMDRGTWGDRFEALGIPLHTIGMKPGMPPTPNIIWRLINLLRRLQPDIIQGWMYHGNLASQVASWFCPRKPPVFWSIHHSINSLSSEKKTTIAIIKSGTQLSKFVKSIIFVSQTSKIQHEKLGYYSQNSCVIPNGFDTSLFIPSIEAKLNVRKELGLAKNTNLIGLIGRYHPIKDHANFLQAAALLTKNNPNIDFILAGREVDKENQDLYQLILELGIGSRVHLLGERRDIPRIMAALDIASSSSYGEAFPLAVGEAMSCGVPCVVTDVGDSGWIVGESGRVVAPKNPVALANAWKELIALGAEGREALGKAARERIIECFALESVVTQYENLYKNALIKN